MTTPSSGLLVLESGSIFPGQMSGPDRAGEVVFNTSHSGYEEMATDPSYFNQILVLTAPQQGNYGEDSRVWESKRIWIDGFVCVEMQNSRRDQAWKSKLNQAGVPVFSDVNTRKLVLELRDRGTQWGALIAMTEPEAAKRRAAELIALKKKQDKDWAYAVSVKKAEVRVGSSARGPKVAVIDFGCKENSIRELMKFCSEVKIFPSRTSAKEIRDYNPSGILLSNGPGDPMDVEVASETVRDLLGWRFIFGICMGHQILGRAMGAKTYKLKFGHRGSNHPIQDSILKKVYMTSQNHGYAVDLKTLPSTVQVSHVNLNDNTVAGIYDPMKKALSVQFHPESHPGPHDAEGLFDFFMRQTQ